MKKIVFSLLVLCFVSISVFAIDGRSDFATKESTVGGGGGGYTPPAPVGMAINEKGHGNPEPSCKPCKLIKKTATYMECDCNNVSHARMIGSNQTPKGTVIVGNDLSCSSQGPIDSKKIASKEDVYVWKLNTKISTIFGDQEPGMEVAMIPLDTTLASGRNTPTPNAFAKDRNPNSVKCACGTDVWGKDEAACGRICDFLKNNTNKSVCPSPSQDIVSPRDSASGLATGRRQYKPLMIRKEIDKSSPLLGRGGTIPGYECDLPTGRDNFTYPILTGIKCELKEMKVDDDITLSLRTNQPIVTKDVDNITNALYTGPCRPPYLCLEVSLDTIRKGRDGSVKGKIQRSSFSSNGFFDVFVEQDIVSPRDSASGLATGRRQYKPLMIRKEIDKSSPLLARGGTTPGYECDLPTGRDNFTYPILTGVKCELKEMKVDDDITLELGRSVSPRDSASGLATGKRQHKPVVRFSPVEAKDCDDASGICSLGIVIEADLDGDGLFEPISNKETPKAVGVNGSGKKEYVGHVTLMK